MVCRCQTTATKLGGQTNFMLLLRSPHPSLSAVSALLCYALLRYPPLRSTATVLEKPGIYFHSFAFNWLHYTLGLIVYLV